MRTEKEGKRNVFIIDKKSFMQDCKTVHLKYASCHNCKCIQVQNIAEWHCAMKTSRHFASSTDSNAPLMMIANYLLNMHIQSKWYTWLFTTYTTHPIYQNLKKTWTHLVHSVSHKSTLNVAWFTSWILLPQTVYKLCMLNAMTQFHDWFTFNCDWALSFYFHNWFDYLLEAIHVWWNFYVKWITFMTTQKYTQHGQLSCGWSGMFNVDVSYGMTHEIDIWAMLTFYHAKFQAKETNERLQKCDTETIRLKIGMLWFNWN